MNKCASETSQWDHFWLPGRDCHCQSPLTVPAQLLLTPHSQPGQGSSQLPPLSSLRLHRTLYSGHTDTAWAVPEAPSTKESQAFNPSQSKSSQPSSSSWVLAVAPSVPCWLVPPGLAAPSSRLAHPDLNLHLDLHQIFPKTMFLYS